MANAYPYANTPGRVTVLLEKVARTGKPGKASQEWLNSVGLTSSNDRRLPPILKFLGFIDASNVPTDRWDAYRGSNPKMVLGQAIREAYSDLFHTFPAAENEPAQTLLPFFRSKGGVGDDTAQRMIGTFKALVALADISSQSPNMPGQDTSSQESGESQDEQADATKSGSSKPEVKGGQPAVVLNVNIQLTLPESTDAAVYEALFSSLARHVLNAGVPVKI